VVGIGDIISFHGESVDEIRHAFKEAMDFYLDTCAERGETPNKPYSGKLMLRVPPEVHAAVATAAEVSGKSINQWAAEAARFGVFMKMSLTPLRLIAKSLS
jgi:predicted HicB family RNase H-like nuclease